MSVAGNVKAPAGIGFKPGIESGAICFAFAVDASVVLFHPHGPGIEWVAVSLAVALVCAVATLTLPSESHRRWVPLAIALAALPAIGYFNPHVGLTGLVLVAVLGSRCTLAFGMRGSAVVALAGALMLAIGISRQLPPAAAFRTFLAALAFLGTLFAIIATFANRLRDERTARRSLEAERSPQRFRTIEMNERFEALSAREREILDLIAEGLTNREIAGHLSLSEGTVKNYVSKILGTLGLRHRTEAALLRQGAGEARRL